MPFLTNKPKGYFRPTSEILLRDSKSYKMKRLFLKIVSLYYVYRIPKLVKVKAYSRRRFGKVEKVRAHYRRVRGRQS